MSDLEKRAEYSFPMLVLRPIAEGGETIMDYPLDMAVLHEISPMGNKYSGDVDIG